MNAVLLLRERMRLDGHSFVDMTVWLLPRALAGSRHPYKYRLAYMQNEACVIRYDNEAGKGDHRHVKDREYTYSFTDVEQLMVDFWSDVDGWRRR